MEFLYKLLSEGISLKATGFLVGLALVASHAFALLRPAPAQAWLKRFPRHKPSGIVLLAAATACAWSWVRYMDLGEFYAYRKTVLLVLPVAFVLVVKFADEFLAVRGLGTFLLLLASPVLSASDPHYDIPSRLLIPLLAYAWITAALFFVGMPFLLRNAITWLTAEPGRYRAASIAGLAYGTLVLLCAFTW